MHWKEKRKNEITNVEMHGLMNDSNVARVAFSLQINQNELRIIIGGCSLTTLTPNTSNWI